MLLIGIYRIRNLLNDKVYIGQSKDIDQRIIYHLQNNSTLIGRDIHYFGRENFEFYVLEQCSEEELDEKEEYWIKFYNSTDQLYGYNIIQGGQHNRNESNPNCKLTENDVWFIRECYKNHSPKYEVYEKYKNKVSKLYFSNLWEGHSWTNIHMDVYTDENIDYYKHKTSLGENSEFAIFTDNEVVEMRKRYINESAIQIYQSVKDRCGFQTLQQILWGRHYKHLPIYNKREKKWIN